MLLFVGLVAVIMLGSTSLILVSIDPEAGQSELDPLVLTPLKIVVSIDESGSVGAAGVQNEARAAALLAAMEVSPESEPPWVC